jgi:hypothetical protein
VHGKKVVYQVETKDTEEREFEEMHPLRIKLPSKVSGVLTQHAAPFVDHDVDLFSFKTNSKKKLIINANLEKNQRQVAISLNWLSLKATHSPFMRIDCKTNAPLKNAASKYDVEQCYAVGAEQFYELELKYAPESKLGQILGRVTAMLGSKVPYEVTLQESVLLK